MMPASFANAQRIAVVIASKGRPLEISYVLQALARQTLPPSAIVLSVVTAADLPDQLATDIKTLFGTAGSSVQRNRGIDEVLPDSDIIVFFDDDFIPADNAIAGLADFFTAHPQITGACGFVIADGVTCGGLSLADAMAKLIAFQSQPPPPLSAREQGWTYGCNMAFRASAIGATRFDENLPLYGWQEDVDFSMRLRSTGGIVKTNAFAGVHLGVNKSRSSGIALGYSQMINPVYLVRKGSMSPIKAGLLMANNFLANHLKSLRPEPWIDRLGRARGNWRGILHLLRGQVDPTAILRF
jgi:GT2 family glycosyltransferase